MVSVGENVRGRKKNLCQPDPKAHTNTQTHPNTTEEHCNLETEFSENKVVGEKGMLKFEETIYHLLLLAFPPPVCFDPQGIKHPV